MAADERLIAKKMAKALTFLCLNEHFKQPLHNGSVPVSKTGDYTDVFIVDAEGKQTVWSQTCRVAYHEREQMVENVTKGIYDFLINVETESYIHRLKEAYQSCRGWKESGYKKRSRKKH